MVTEDYVNFECAKLLKEKKFEQHKTRLAYNKNGKRRWSDDLDPFEFSAPTLQMAMKWLREVYNIHCDIGYDDLDWFWNILNVSDSVSVEERPKMIKDGTAGHKTYEEACESAIKYCLTNLI